MNLPEPTQALPGTPEKLAVLIERHRLGQPLWHPQDAESRPVPSWLGHKDQRCHRIQKKIHPLAGDENFCDIAIKTCEGN